MLPGEGEQPPPLSLQKPLCLKKLVRTAQAEAKGWAPGHSPGPPDTLGQRPVPDVRHCFTISCRNVCRVLCTLCHRASDGAKSRGGPSVQLWSVTRQLSTGGRWGGSQLQPALGRSGEGGPKRSRRTCPRGPPAVPLRAAITMLPPDALPLEDGDGQAGLSG